MYFILRELLPSLFLIMLISLVLCLVGLSMSVAWHAVTRVGVKNGALRRGPIIFLRKTRVAVSALFLNSAESFSHHT